MSRKTLQTKWCISFEYVDRTTLFDAVRGNEKWRDDVIHRGNVIDEHDPDTIGASIYVDDLDELRELLVATKDVRSEWGTVLHMRTTDEGPVQVGATLASKEAQFTTDCSLSVRPPLEGEGGEVYTTLVEVARKVNGLVKSLGIRHGLESQS